MRSHVARRRLALVLGIALFVIVGCTAAPPPQPSRQLVLIIDGLRPDYVTRELMPNLFGLGERGAVYTNHHAVFPTVTRVNAASIATGAYPEHHGLMGNTIYVQAVDVSRSLSTAERENLEAVESATSGQLLTVASLGELLRSAGRKLLVVSSGSTGSAFLLNHRPAGGSAVLHTDYTLPAELHGHIIEVLGPSPEAGAPSAARNRRAIDAYVQIGLDEIVPDATFIWLTDPDTTAHEHGVGAPATREALRLVDNEIGRIERALADRQLLDTTNIMVTSDHGFSTHTAELNLGTLLEPFAGRLADGSPALMNAGGAIHLRGQMNPSRLLELIRTLQQRPEVGAIFTRPRAAGDSAGVAPGTLSFDIAHWNHERAGDILVSANWTDSKNEHGFAGTTTQGGVAGHGTSSPYDIHNTLIAAGPDFRAAVRIDVPSANVDLAPTVLHLLNLPIPPTMTGRVLDEALQDGRAPESVAVSQRRYVSASEDGSYVVTAHVSVVDGRSYLDYTEVRRPALGATR